MNTRTLWSTSDPKNENVQGAKHNEQTKQMRQTHKLHMCILKVPMYFTDCGDLIFFSLYHLRLHRQH